MSAGVSPPRVARLLLRMALPAGFEAESVLGDFHEDYIRLHAHSRWQARLWYWREALDVGARALSVRAGGVFARPSTGGRAGRSGSSSGRPPRWRRLATRLEAMLTDDFPHAVRNLAMAPGFTAVAVLSLTLGIAPLATIGGFVNAMFFRPPAHVAEPDRLVAMFQDVGGPVSWPNLADVAQQVDGLQDLAAFSTHNNFNLTEGEVTRTLMGSEVSTNYFDVTRVPLVRGRGFAADEMGRGSKPVVVISYTFWQRQFDGGAEALGQTLRINGRDHTVIGITPEGLVSLEMPVEPDVYVPLSVVVVEARGRRGTYGVGRLRQGFSLADVQAQLIVVQERLRETYPEYWLDEPGTADELSVHPLQALRLRPGQEGQVAAVIGLVGFLGLLVLVTACANLGNLLLARGWQRGGEIAVRLALGADRSRLITMLLAESVLLGCSGGALAALTAHWLTQALKSGLIGPGFRLDLGIDWRVLVFTATVSIATGILFGLVPALRASSPELTAALKGERHASGPGRMLSFRNILVAGQVAASLALLVSAGVLLRSVQMLQDVDPGFDPQGALIVRLDLGQRTYSEVEGRQFFEQLVARIAEVPDVESAALAIDLPLDGTLWMNTVVPHGAELPEDGYFLAQENRVSPPYFNVMRMPILRGRGFTPADAGDVVVINEAFEQRFWPEGALGEQLDVAGRTASVIGVVRDAKYGSLGESPAPIHFWRPWQVDYVSAVNLVVRTGTDPGDLVATVRRLVREADADLPVLEPRLMSELVGASSEEQRVASALLALIGIVALSLAVVGIYGVLSFVVSRRTGEVGVRIALGARPGDVVRMVLTQGMRMVLAGVALGLVVAFAIAQVLAAAMPGVEALDPVAPAAAVMLLLACAAAATLVPALRASRVDPMVALRRD